MDKDMAKENGDNLDVHTFTQKTTIMMNLSGEKKGPNRRGSNVDMVMEVATRYIKGIKNDEISRLTGKNKNAIRKFIKEQINACLLTLLETYNQNIDIQNKLAKKYSIERYEDLEKFHIAFNDKLISKNDPQKNILTGLKKHGDMNTYLMIKKVIELNGGKISEDADINWWKFLASIKGSSLNSFNEFISMVNNISEPHEIYIYLKVIQCIYISVGFEEAEKILGEITEKSEIEITIKLLFNVMISSITNKLELYNYRTESNKYNFQLFDKLIAKVRVNSKQSLECSKQINAVSDYCMEIRIKSRDFGLEVLTMYKDNESVIRNKKQVE